jgi:hypothetical protein
MGSARLHALNSAEQEQPKGPLPVGQGLAHVNFLNALGLTTSHFFTPAQPGQRPC